MIISLIFVAFSASCEHKPMENETIRLGYVPIADAAQIYVAIEKGFFSEQNIEIEFEQLNSGARILEAVSTGSVKIGLTSYVPLVLANASGLQLQAVTGGAVEDKAHPEHAMLVHKDSPIKAVTDLVGKTIALNGRRNIDHLILQELLEKNEIREDQIKIVEIPFPRMESVLSSKEIDAACMIEPYVTRAIEHGNTRVMIQNFLAVYDKIPIACYAAKKEWIGKNQKLLRRFRTAIKKATLFCLSNSEQTKKIIAKYTQLTEDEIRKVGLPTFTDETNPEELQDLIERMFRRGLISSKMNSQDLIYVE
jgi:NitT/TauT family transport system substrate-binding protein